MFLLIFRGKNIAKNFVMFRFLLICQLQGYQSLRLCGKFKNQKATLVPKEIVGEKAFLLTADDVNLK